MFPCLLICFVFREKFVILLFISVCNLSVFVVVQSLSHVLFFETSWTAGLLCPPLFPGVCSNSCPLSLWCCLTTYPLPPPSPFAFNLSQKQGLFQWVGSSHQVARVLELQHQSFQWVFRVSWIFLISFRIDWWSPCSPRDSRIFSYTTVWKHQFLRAQPSLWSNSHIWVWLL